MEVLHPDNKIRYNDGDRVQIALNGDPQDLYEGTIVGLASEHIIDYWIIELDYMLPNWSYHCITQQHTFIRPRCDNRPFLCEGVSRI